MPHHKSCKKRVLLAEKARIRNKQMKSRIKTATKKVTTASDVETASVALKTAYSVLDRASKAGVIHKKKAANQKAKLSKITAAVTA